MDTFKQLQILTETPGPSGNEAAIGAAIEKEWRPLVDEIRHDRLGNLIGVKFGNGAGSRPSILIAAHMDEIGLMVHEIVEHQGNGFLRVTNLGGVDLRHLYGQLVIVHGRQSFKGVLGSLPASFLPKEKQNAPYGYEELVVDIGQDIESVRATIAVGDFISFFQPLRQLLHGRVAGKALDNRASVTAVSVCLEYLQSRRHAWDVLAVATVQEETRLLGAFTSAHSQQPDLALAIDVCFGKGPGATDTGTFELASGPMLDIGPNVHTGVYKALQKTAKELEMNVSLGTHSRGSGTDAWGLQVARAGIPTGLISIPLRYMHTMVESVALKDIERSGRLMGEFIATLELDFAQKLAESLMKATE
jgi:endoglucanase